MSMIKKPIEPKEPLIPINHTGWALRAGTLIQIVVLLVPIIGAWYNLNGTQEIIKRDIGNLSAQVDTYRQERISEIKELRKEGDVIGKDVTRLQEQIKALQVFIGEMRREGKQRFDEQDNTKTDRFYKHDL